MKNLSEKFATFSQDFRNVHQEAKKQGFVNIMKLLWKDLFVGRTANHAVLSDWSILRRRERWKEAGDRSIERLYVPQKGPSTGVS